MITIRLHRHRIRTTTCDGTLSINGTFICDTTEHAFFRVATGTYRIGLRYNDFYRRKVPTLIPMNGHKHFGEEDANGHCLTTGNGIFNKCDSRILLGTHIVPGCLRLSRDSFTRLYDRLDKSQRRGHEVMLMVTE